MNFRPLSHYVALLIAALLTAVPAIGGHASHTGKQSKARRNV